MKKKKQKVIRTYPNGCDTLQNAMNQGYYVVMCNKIILQDKTEILEYIVEKEEEYYN